MPSLVPPPQASANRAPLRSSLVKSTLLFALALTLASCRGGLNSEQTHALALKGNVHGGQQPIAGSLIQIYAVGTGGDASAATPLTTQTITTSDGSGNASDGNGNAGNGYNAYPAGDFDLTGYFACVNDSDLIYIVATGGNPGFAGTVDNSAIGLMAVLGQCSDLTASTFISINEETTVASIAPLASYMTSFATLGSGTADLSQFQTAFAEVQEYVNTGTGQLPGPTLPSGYYASSTEIVTLADAIATCINSDGSTAPNTPCATLFQYTTPPGGTAPADTIGAAINIAKYPTNNICPIYDLATPTGPYQPTLQSCPTDWTLPILETPSAPTFTPAAGTYPAGQTVTLETTPTDAVIHYTTDGSTPTASSTIYTGAFSVSATTTINALAIEDGRASSSVASGTFTIDAGCTTCITPHPATAPPTFSPGSGAYTVAQSVTLSDTTAGATIYYTTDGSTPGFTATKYTGPITVSKGETINAIATAPLLDNSPVASATYTINQYPIEYTIAGNGNYPMSPGDEAADGQQATSGMIDSLGIAVDASGNVYVSEPQFYEVRKISPSGVISTFAGNGTMGNSGDGGQASAAQIGGPAGLAFDSAGNLYITDASYSVVRKVTPAGIISTFAGLGAEQFGPYTGDGGPATSAPLSYPQAVAVDNKTGNVYIADVDHWAVRVVYPSGIIGTIAGNGNNGTPANGVGATSTGLGYIAALAVDGSGNVLMTDETHCLVYRVSGGVLTYFAGNGDCSSSLGGTGDGGPATSAGVYYPEGIAVDSTGIVYIGAGNRVRRVLPSGIIDTVAGGSFTGYLPYIGAQYDDDGVLATHVASVGNIWAIAVDASDNFYFTDYLRDRKVTFQATLPALPPPSISPDGGTFPTGSTQSVSITDGDNLAAIYYTTNGSTPTTSSTLYTGAISVTGNETIKAIAVETGFPESSIASAAFVFEAGAATPTFNPPGGVYTTAQNVTISDATTGSTIYYTTDGSTPTTASTPYTGAITVAANETINAIAVATGHATSAVGAATYVIAPNGTAATPVISPASGTYSTSQAITITDGSAGVTIYYTTDGSTPTSASNVYTGPFNLPAGSYTVTAIAEGTGYANSVTASATYTFLQPGSIVNIAGTGSYGYNNDGGGSATAAQLNSPDGVAVDSNGNVFFSDFYNNLVRMVTPSGTISTVIGQAPTLGPPLFNGFYGCLSIFSPSLDLNGPAGLAIDSSNNIYIADSNNNIVRKLTPNGTLPNGTTCTGGQYAATTIAGGATWTTGTPPAGYTGDGGLAANSTLHQPSGVAVDASGNVFIADTGNGVIRMIAGTTANGFTAGSIYTVAGLGYASGPLYGGDGGPATAANFNTPTSVAVDSSGNVYVADWQNSCVRVFQVGGNVNTFAGTCTSSGYQVGALSGSLLNTPIAVAVDTSGNVYITDENNERVLVAYTTGPNAGTIAPIAGNGTAGNIGVGAPATNYELNHPNGIVVDKYGNVFIADESNDLIRKVIP